MLLNEQYSLCLDSVSDIYTFFSINSDLQSLIPALPV